MVLKELDIRWLPNGNRNIFSMKYVKKSGEIRFIPQAYACGLPYDMRSNRQRGLQPCDCGGNKEGHVLPVGIDRIIMYNNMEVIL